MIALFTDFGLDGLYVGQMHAIIATALPAERVVDLCHSLPPQNITSAAYLLPAYSRFLPPASVTVCVVDPGVGSPRPHAVCDALRLRRASGEEGVEARSGQPALLQHRVRRRQAAAERLVGVFRVDRAAGRIDVQLQLFRDLRVERVARLLEG